MFASLSQLKVIQNRVARSFVPRTGKALRDSATFLKSCYIDGTRSLLRGNYGLRQGAVIIAASVPAIIGALLITLPGVLFPTPAHQAFHYFAQTLESDTLSLLPAFLGLVSSTLGLRVPVA